MQCSPAIPGLLLPYFCFPCHLVPSPCNAALPFLVSHPLPQDVAEGENLTLTCSAGGSPIPSLSWQFDGVEVSFQLLVLQRTLSATSPYFFTTKTVQEQVLKFSMLPFDYLYKYDRIRIPWCVPGVCPVCAQCVPGVCLVCGLYSISYRAHSRTSRGSSLQLLLNDSVDIAVVSTTQSVTSNLFLSSVSTEDAGTYAFVAESAGGVVRHSSNITLGQAFCECRPPPQLGEGASVGDMTYWLVLLVCAVAPILVTTPSS